MQSSMDLFLPPQHCLYRFSVQMHVLKSFLLFIMLSEQSIYHAYGLSNHSLKQKPTFQSLQHSFSITRKFGLDFLNSFEARFLFSLRVSSREAKVSPIFLTSSIIDFLLNIVPTFFPESHDSNQPHDF